MVDPQRHAQERGWIEAFARWIPGFSGYLDREDRRESDRLLRTYAAEQAAACKQAITQHQRSLLDSGKLDDMTSWERAVGKCDRLANEFRGDVQGYSGFFDFVTIGSEVLAGLYELDKKIVSDLETLGKKLKSPGDLAAAEIIAALDSIAEEFGRRRRTLEGLSGGD